MKDLGALLETRRAQGLYRSREIIDGPQGVNVHIDGRPYLSFCSNDYLGLAADPRLVDALRRGASYHGPERRGLG